MSKNNRHQLVQGNEYLPAIAFLVRSLADENRLRILDCGMKNNTGILLVDTRQEWEYRTGH